MQIEIHDSSVEARIRRQIRMKGAANAEEALLDAYLANLKSQSE